MRFYHPLCLVGFVLLSFVVNGDVFTMKSLVVASRIIVAVSEVSGYAIDFLSRQIRINSLEETKHRIYHCTNFRTSCIDVDSVNFKMHITT